MPRFSARALVRANAREQSILGRPRIEIKRAASLGEVFLQSVSDTRVARGSHAARHEPHEPPTQYERRRLANREHGHVTRRRLSVLSFL